METDAQRGAGGTCPDARPDPVRLCRPGGDRPGGGGCSGGQGPPRHRALGPVRRSRLRPLRPLGGRRDHRPGGLGSLLQDGGPGPHRGHPLRHRLGVQDLHRRRRPHPGPGRQAGAGGPGDRVPARLHHGRRAVQGHHRPHAAGPLLRAHGGHHPGRLPLWRRRRERRRRAAGAARPPAAQGRPRGLLRLLQRRLYPGPAGGGGGERHGVHGLPPRRHPGPGGPHRHLRPRRRL